MKKFPIKNMKKFIAVSRTTKEISSNIKQQYALTYEELFILVHVHEKRLPAYNVKDIITVSKFKPYYITKALQKLKENGYLSKKRNEQDERTVIIEISKEQYAKIDQLFEDIESKF
ncbi:transcriptional regulator, SarA/Rot family [Staphylococcus agnetis]|uniref:transcriptional regulator, SarA/Rot family n=1 Tax=Staphylococcus agnetis TaxID=985762 RepID=UPI00208E19B6|nr:MarR family transcriptional regulator [Staphylococcus agnetis]MCO4347382.1 MarR family transcriptional regulator [Staphylococcus agnetis]